MKRQTLFTIVSSLISVFALVVVLFLLQKILVPKYADELVEGRFISEYYEEKNKDFDVLFLGDCEVYESFAPTELWQEYGVNSYIRGSANQYIWQSYYLLKDTLRYDTPDVCVVGVLPMIYDHATNEAYNRMTLEGMEWSRYKVSSIITSMREEENFSEYVFPILRYHDRWDDLNKDDIKYMFKSSPKVTFNGYYMRTDVKSAKDFGEGKVLADYDFSEKCMQYLDMIRMCCESNDIELILIKAPSLYPYWYEEWDEQIVDYADEYGITYINYSKITEETGIDYSTDTYDGGLHMNLSGAKKLTLHLGNVLIQKGVEDRRDEDTLNDIWNEKILRYNAAIEKQKEER